jgi:hypothetical protein
MANPSVLRPVLCFGSLVRDDRIDFELH